MPSALLKELVINRPGYARSLTRAQTLKLPPLSTTHGYFRCIMFVTLL